MQKKQITKRSSVKSISKIVPQSRKSTSFHSTTPTLSKKFADTWTQQAKALGYPSRAVFKLMQAQKRHRLIHPGDVVVDLGCSPGSWSKLSSTIASGHGFVLGMDLTTMSPHEQAGMGVRQKDINQRFEHPKTYDDGSSKSMLATERKVFKSKSPVGYMNQDVTQWVPGPGFLHNTDVILSDMAPNTTGVPSQDSAESIELCFSVIDLCSKLFKPPSTKIVQFTGKKERDIALSQLRDNPNNENVLISHLTAQFNKNMEKEYGLDNVEVTLKNAKEDDNSSSTTTTTSSTSQDNNTSLNENQSQGVTAGPILHHASNKANLRIMKKTLKQHVYLQKQNAVGIIDGEIDSAIYKTDERTLSQIQNNEQYSTRWSGTLMMKVFQGDGITELIDILKQIFVSTYTFKPESSRSESVEVFLICKGYCGPFEGTRITNKHIRRPKTEDYLRSYVSNNRKRPPVPHDPTKSPRFLKLTGNPNPRPPTYDPKTIHEMKTANIKGLSVSDLYSQLGHDQSSVSFTSDDFKRQQAEQREVEHFHQTIQQTISSGVTTNVHAAIKNTSSLDPGTMSPLQREISESDDIVIYQQRQFDELYGQNRASVNKVPSVEDLMKSMSLYWDEGINFAKRMTVESQTPARIDVFQGRKHTVFDDINKDDVTALMDDGEVYSNTPITSSSILNQFHKDTGKKSTKKVPSTVGKKTQSRLDTHNNEDESSYEMNAIDAILLKYDAKPEVESKAPTTPKKTTKATQKTTKTAKATKTTQEATDSVILAGGNDLAAKVTKSKKSAKTKTSILDTIDVDDKPLAKVVQPRGTSKIVLFDTHAEEIILKKPKVTKKSSSSESSVVEKKETPKIKKVSQVTKKTQSISKAIIEAVDASIKTASKPTKKTQPISQAVIEAVVALVKKGSKTTAQATQIESIAKVTVKTAKAASKAVVEAVGALVKKDSKATTQATQIEPITKAAIKKTKQITTKPVIEDNVSKATKRDKKDVAQLLSTPIPVATKKRASRIATASILPISETISETIVQDKSTKTKKTPKKTETENVAPILQEVPSITKKHTTSKKSKVTQEVPIPITVVEESQSKVKTTRKKNNPIE